MISVVIPAHNEQSVLSRCLEALLAEADTGEFEVVVVCNGCSDDTAQVARGFGSAVHVCEISVASKIAALNEGDARVSGFPRFYLDADIVLGTRQLREVAAALDDQSLMAAAPRAVVDLNGASLGVRAFYHVWQRTPHIVFVAMGQPLQEEWALSLRAKLPRAVFHCVGGLFDVVSGRLRNGPIWARRAGLEWAVRFAQEPARLWRRYLIGLPHVLCLVVAKRLQGQATSGGRTRLGRD